MSRQRGKVEVDHRRCKGCELCVDVCPQKVLHLSKEIGPFGHYPAVFDESERHCTACRLCVIVCPDVAMTLYALDPADAPKG